MSIELTLDATLRKEQGKGASRRLRRAKQVPAILYGAGKDAVSLTVGEEQLLRLMREEVFFSQIIDVKVKGKKTERVVLKDLQRHPFKQLVTHLDLQRIREGHALRVHLPIHFLNEDTATGAKQQGGVIHHDMIEVEIECLPKDLPEYLELDLADLELDQAIHLSQLSVPEGVLIPALDHDPVHDPAVVSIHAPRLIPDEDEEEAAAEGAEASAEPSEDKEDKEDKD